MAFRATKMASDPLNYFIHADETTDLLHVSDIVLRSDADPSQFFSRVIRLATNSSWTHSALLYLISDPPQGFDNTFLVEAMVPGIHVTSWRTEVYPLERFTVGIRRLPLDWYSETPKEKSQHNAEDPEDTHGIAYLRHVRGMAIDQINGLYSHNVINELTALYIERVAKRYDIPIVAQVAEDFATLFEQWDEAPDKREGIVRFICSGLVQYSFFAALRWRIIKAMDVAESRDAAMSNLSNLHRVIFCPDPDGIIPDYIQQIQHGKLKISDPIPANVQNLLKTTTPADLNNSPNLDWQYVINSGNVWHIENAPDDYTTQNGDEDGVLQLVKPQHMSVTPQQQQVS